MRVKIRTNGFRMTFYFPNAVLFGKLAVSIAAQCASDYVTISDEQKGKLACLLKQCGKQYKGLKLIEVHSSEGEQVEITL